MFGNSNTSGMFGGANSSAPKPGGLFGGASNTNNAGSTGGGLFGGNSNTNTNATGLFNTSGNATNSGTSGGLFGGSGGFGGNTGASGNTGTGSAGTGGLFGGNTNTSSNTGLFGGNNQASGQNGQSGATGGLFGTSNNNTTNTGLFGTNSNNNNNTNTGGLFGSNTNTNNANSTGGLFGNTNNNTNNNTNTNTNTNTNSNSNGLFGNNTNNTLFNQPQQQSQQAQQSQNFNQQPNQFNNQLNQTQFQNQNFNTFDDKKAVYVPSINDQLIKIKEQWDPNSHSCKLKTHFYNKLNEQETNMVLNQPRPANESPDDWNSAMSERPSNQYYPTKITSFSDVSNRIETQLDHVKKSRYLLNLINDNQSKLSAKHDLDNTTRIKNCKTKHTQLSRRLLRLATVLAILKLRGYPLLPEEEEISKQFEHLISKLNDPNNALSKLNDLFARLIILKEKSENMNTSLNQSINVMNENLDNIDDVKSENDNSDELVVKVSKLLLKQQKGLNYVNEVISKDMELADKLVK